MYLYGRDSKRRESGHRDSMVYHYIEFRPCGMSVCRVLIQKTSRSGRASGSQCSNGTILWSLRKSCDFLAKWRYRGIRLFVSEKCRCARKRTLRLLEVRPMYSLPHLLQMMQ